LRTGVAEATVVLAVIGPGWLLAADKYGRRRLDLPDDWVRNELLQALQANKPVSFVRVAGAELPDEEGLPEALRPVLRHQDFALRDQSWDRDVNALARVLIDEYGFVDNETRIETPRPEVVVAPLSAAEVETAIADLPGWELVESLIPGDYPRSRHELRKIFRFTSFRTAMRFMQAAPDQARALKHHPRWENQWKTVTVYLTTWDIGNRISRLDVDAAKMFDAVDKEVRRESSGQSRADWIRQAALPPDGVGSV
jgi:pterin-4a-carbinolamine dehydratase